MKKYEAPRIVAMRLDLAKVEMAGRCLTKSSNCGHGEDGCVTPDHHKVVEGTILVHRKPLSTD
jgi:hypothetical protein